MKLLILCLNFFKAGLFGVGGGLATLPFITSMSNNHPDWFSKADIANMIAISESTPGPMGVNMATYVGYHMYGVPGAILTTFSLVLPSFIVILIVSRLWRMYKENETIKSVFASLRPAALGLITAAGFTVFIIALFPGFQKDGFLSYLSIYKCLDIRTAILFIVLMVGTQLPKIKKLHPLAFIAAGAVAGIALGL